MNCRLAKLEIALCVGEDLTDADRREQLRRHLTGCPVCRAHFKQLKGMFHVLEQAEEQQTYDSADSLWPNLAGRLGQPRPRRQGPRFNGWVPFSVMAAACVLLMIVMETQPTDDTVVSARFARSLFGMGIDVEPDTTPERRFDPHNRADLISDQDEVGPAAQGLVAPLDVRASSDSTF